MYKATLGIVTVLALALMLGAGIASAQIYPDNTSMTPGGTTTNPGTTTTPGIPNTGAGGGLYQTLLLLFASASLIVIGAVSLRQLSRDLSRK